MRLTSYNSALHRILATLTLPLSLLAITSSAHAEDSELFAAQALGSAYGSALSCEEGYCAQARVAMGEGAYDEAARLFILQAYRPVLGSLDVRRADWIVQAAFAQGRASNHDEAARLFWQAGKELPELRDFLFIKAARHMLDGVPSATLLEDIKRSGALERGYAGSELVRARIEAHVHAGLPQPASTKAALQSADREVACTWLLDTLVKQNQDPDKEARDPAQLAALATLASGSCVEAEYAPALKALNAKPDALARLSRADLFFYQVRYDETQKELDALDLDALDVSMRCRALFRQGRTHFRRRNWAAADAEFKKITRQCADDGPSENYYVRSLYAVGRYAHDRNQLNDSEAMFRRLFEKFPHRSHADDALFYLARIERKRGNKAREIELLHQALRAYPNEDMVHEMAWEVHEALFRGGKFKEFIEAIEALPLPEYDNQYFSQGRLEYFLAAAYGRLGNQAKSIEIWQENWKKYPFSFYGYLSNLRIRERGATPASLEGGEAARQTDWFGESWQNHGAARLVRLNLFEDACDFETAHLSRSETSNSDRWRQATLCHIAGRYPVSHNIPRRQIPGSPWMQPVEGRLIRWQVAFPNPFAQKISDAVEAERVQWTGPQVHGALASSIMREESAFIPDNISWAGALGLMQLMPATALGHDKDIEGRATPERLLEPAINIRVAIDHIFSLANRFDSHPVLMTAAYNAGGGRVTQWLRSFPNEEIALFVENIPFLETRDYTKRVIGSYGAYQWLSGQHVLDPRVAQPARRP